MQLGERRMLGELLLEMGAIDRAQLRVGLIHHHEAHVPLGRALIREGACSEDDVLRALAAQLGVEAVDLAHEPPDPTLADLVPAKVARRYRVVPLRIDWKGDRECLHVALPAPASLEALDAVRAVTGKPRVEPHLASDAALARSLARLYGEEEPADEPAGPAPAPADQAVMLYGWPPVTAVLITRALAKHGVRTRVATPLEVLHTTPADLVFAPVQAMEGLLAGEVRVAGALLVQHTEDDGFERARQLGARGFVANPLDAELLVRAIRRMRSGDDGASLNH
jgi:hypothetical protein